MTVLDEGEIEIVFFNVMNAGRFNAFEQHPSGIRIIEGIYQVSFTTMRTMISGSGNVNVNMQETHLVIVTSGVMGLRVVGKSTQKLCGTPEIATPTAPSEYTLSLWNIVNGRPVTNGVDEHIIPI